MQQNSSTETLTRSEKRRLNILIVIVVLIAVGISASLVATKAKPKTEASINQSLLVKTMPLQVVSQQATISAMGKVVPAKYVNLKPEVSGRVVAIHPEFLAGGRLKEGEVLLEIEKKDYELALQQAEAKLAIAEAAFEIEKGQQQYAKTEWKILQQAGSVGGADKELILRKPQLREKEANLKAAQAGLEQAKLNLERTQIKAPFDAIVMSKMVDIGEMVSPNASVAEIAGVASYWVRTSLPIKKLGWFDMEGSKVSIVTNSDVTKEGKLLKLFSDLTPNGNLAQVLIEIPQPVAMNPPLLLGEFVNVEIIGKPLPDAIPIPREALREGNKIWLMQDETLHIESVDVVWKEKEQVFIEGKYSGQTLVVSSISAPVEGLALKAMQNSEPPQIQQGE